MITSKWRRWRKNDRVIIEKWIFIIISASPRFLFYQGSELCETCKKRMKLNCFSKRRFACQTNRARRTRRPLRQRDLLHADRINDLLRERVRASCAKIANRVVSHRMKEIRDRVPPPLTWVSLQRVVHLRRQQSLVLDDVAPVTGTHLTLVRSPRHRGVRRRRHTIYLDLCSWRDKLELCA